MNAQYRWTVIAALTLFALSGCARRDTAAVVALKTDLIGLKAAAAQGVTVREFSALVLDTRTKFELARNDLSQDQVATIEYAVVAAEDTKIIWNGTIDSDMWDAEIAHSFVDIGLVKSVSDFDYQRYVVNAETLNDEEAGGHQNFSAPFIRRALGIVDTRTTAALKAIDPA
jgi:hypothetical protein